MIRYSLFALWLVFAPFEANAQLATTSAGPVSLSTGTVTPYTGPGDIVAGAFAWWGMRGYTAAFAGAAINICLPLDASCVDVAVSNGNLVVGTITTLGCNDSTTICTIKTAYDQTGNGRHAQNAVIASRPILKVSCQNGKPCAAPAGSNFLAAANITLAQPYTFSAVARRSSGTGFQTVIANNGGSIYMGYSNAANRVECDAPTAITVSAVADGALHTFNCVLNGGSSNFMVDGANTAGAGGANGFSAVTLYLMYDQAGSDFLNGLWMETGVWGSALTTGNLSSFNTNAKNFWGF